MNAVHLTLIDSVASEPATTPPPGALRVAIATQDLRTMNAHFGSARRFAIYDVTTEGWSFVGAVSFDDVADESGSHRIDGDDRIGPKVKGLDGCRILFCLAIGGPAAAKLVAANVHPVKLPQPQPIETVLARTRDMLAGSPPPWLRKALALAGIHEKPRFYEEAGP